MSKLNDFKNKIKNKKVVVLGIGISNMPAIKYLVKLGAIVTACDKKEDIGDFKNKLEDLNVNLKLGKDYLKGLNNFDYIFRSPGIKPFTKELLEAKENGVIITSEIENVIKFSPCKVIGVTGSDGKSTTTTLISMILENAGYTVYKGGNIGIPLFDKLDEMKENDVVVLELSSFQLMDITVSPNISVITNISENHLDYHRSFEEYILAKANVFKFNSDLVVFNYDNDYTNKYLKIIDNLKLNLDIKYFSIKEELNKKELNKKGTYLKDNYIVTNINEKEEKICNISEIKLLGIHNIANICTAISAIYNMVSIQDILSVITTFKGVEHRMEFVREVNGVIYYNDSIASSPTRTIAGLNCFDKKIILIAGGYDKNISYDSIGKYIIDKVKILILVGATSNKIKKSVLDEKEKNNLNEICEIVEFDSLDKCVDYVSGIVKSGDIVAMSPASASFDMYKNFEERGKKFKSLINKL